MKDFKHQINFFDSEEAKRSLDEWQKKLGLQDWEIIVEIYNNDNGDFGKNDLGYVSMDHINKIACVGLLKRVESDKKFCVEPMEVTLIHELLHVKLDFVSISDRPVKNYEYDVLGILHERNINDLAKSFYCVKHDLSLSSLKNKALNERIFIQDGYNL